MVRELLIRFNFRSRSPPRWHGLRTKLLSHFFPQLRILADITHVYSVERKTTGEKAFVMARNAVALENRAVGAIDV
tara:strand:+ start:464 stop:691 length:228 start_codon:yes stop_codon:yes gene_type:complete